MLSFKPIFSLSFVILTRQASLSITNSQSLLKLMSIQSVMPSNHLILCHPRLLLPSLFPSIRVFLIESVLCIRWPKYWSFSFSISPSNEYSGLISFRIDWLDILDLSSISAIIVVSSAYLRLLIFLPSVLIPACDSLSLVFYMMYYTYNLNKQGDDIQPFPIWILSFIPCFIITISTVLLEKEMTTHSSVLATRTP